jgi:hypothetical protein
VTTRLVSVGVDQWLAFPALRLVESGVAQLSLLIFNCAATIADLYCVCKSIKKLIQSLDTDYFELYVSLHLAFSSTRKRSRFGFLGRGCRRRCHHIVGGRVVARVCGRRLALLGDKLGLELVDALRRGRGRGRRGRFRQLGSDLLLLHSG